MLHQIKTEELEKNTSATDFCEKRNHLSNFVRDTLTLVVAAAMADLALGSQ